MDLSYVPLLHIQRDLQAIPRGMLRFRRYLRALSADGKSLDLPSLGIVNPMGREHFTLLLDEFLALGADAIAARAVAEASAELLDIPGAFKVALVVVDDLKGGWTNRYDQEFNLRFGHAHHSEGDPRPRWLKEDWVTAVLWSSEPASERAVRDAVRAAIHRAARRLRNGPARTLRDMLAQEGHVLVAADSRGYDLDEEELAYTREVIAPFLNADDKRTAVECLFGDVAARSLGFTARGLSPWAGIALAVFDARYHESTGAHKRRR